MKPRDSILLLISLTQLYGASVDLSKAHAEFPTRAVGVNGCSIAYDSREQKLVCPGLPVRIEVLDVAMNSDSSSPAILSLRVINTSRKAIAVPLQAARAEGAIRQNFLQFNIRLEDAPELLDVMGFAFGSHEVSSTLNLEPDAAIIYKLALNLTKLPHGKPAGIPIVIGLQYYEIGKNSDGSEVSTLQGKEIRSATFFMTSGRK